MTETKHRTTLRRRMRADLERQRLPRLIAVFLLAILLLGLVLASLAGVMQEIYRREKRQTRLHAIGAISDSMQKALGDVQEVATWIYAVDSDRVFSLLRQQPEQLRQQLAERIRDEVSLRSVSLYAADEEQIIAGCSDATVNTEEMLSCLPLSYTGIIALLQDSPQAYVLLPLDKPGSSSFYRDLESFVYVQRIASARTGESLGLLVACLRREELRAVIGLSQLTAGENLIVLNDRDETVMRVGDFYRPDDLAYGNLQRGYNKPRYYSPAGERVEVYGGNEYGQPYKTALCVRYDDGIWANYPARIGWIVAGTALGVLLLLYLLGVLVFQTRTLSQISSLLRHKDEGEINRSLIEDANSLEGMVSREIIYAHSLKKQNEGHLASMKRRMLVELLTARSPVDTREIECAFSRQGTPVENVYFSVAIFACGGMQPEEGRERLDKEYELLRFVVENIFRDYGECYALLMQEWVVCLFSDERALTVADMCRYAATAAQVCVEELGHPMTCGVGNVSRGLRDISQSYYRAVCALEQAAADGRQVCGPQDCLRSAKEGETGNVIEEKYRLLTVIRGREPEKGRPLFEKLLHGMAADPHISGEFMRVQVYELLHTVIRELSGEFENDDVADRLLRRAEAVFYCQDQTELEQLVLAVFDEAIAAVRRPDEENAFLQTIFRIVEQEYGNPDLSVGFLAEKTGINARTLSAKFIKSTGKGLLDHIHSVRIGHAKTLLVQGRLSVQEVATAVGYENVNTFIRVFKRYCYMTPGAYQESVLSRGGQPPQL